MENIIFIETYFPFHVIFIKVPDSVSCSSYKDLRMMGSEIVNVEPLPTSLST